MIERVLLTLIIVGAALASYRLLNWWTLHRIRQRGLEDPLLHEFEPGRPAILYFTADHCAACRLQQKPMLTRLRQDIDIQIIQIDTQQHPQDAERWGVMSLPTTFVLDEYGKPQSVNYGVASIQTLRKQLETLKRI